MPEPGPGPERPHPASQEYLPVRFCQCGNQKEPKDEACQSCEAKDRRTAAA